MTLTPLQRAPVYSLAGVTKAYGSGSRRIAALQDVSLEIDAGEFLVVVGPSGSGKTTLLQLLGALDRPTSGSVVFEGRDLALLGERDLTSLRLGAIGFVFQQFNLIPTLTAAQNVEAALAPSGMRRRARGAAVRELLQAVGLGARASHLPTQLSGGEQQRVAIARALANEPRVLLADEPTGTLDSTTGAEIVDLLRGLSEERGQTVVLITHDVAIAASAPRVVSLEDGRVAGSAAARGLEAAR